MSRMPFCTRLQRLRDAGDRPAIALDELDLVLGLRGDALLDGGHEIVSDVGDIDGGAVRVTGADAKGEVLGERMAGKGDTAEKSGGERKPATHKR